MLRKLEQEGNVIENDYRLIFDVIASSTDIETEGERAADTFFIADLLIILLLIPLALVSCTEVQVSSSRGLYESDPPVIGGDLQPPSYDSSINVITEELQPEHDVINQSLCQLDPPISTVRKQENSAWCWASSTQLVLEHLEQRKIEQCAVVHTALTDEREEYERQHAAEDVHVDCCTVTDEALKTADRNDKHVQASTTVCHTTYRPEWALADHGYAGKFTTLRYDPSNNAPQGLNWKDLTGQICANRPFISVKLWDEGGTHSEVVTGYRINPDAEVEMDTHGMDTFYVIPYMDYLGKPGESVHVRDYVNIGE